MSAHKTKDKSEMGTKNEKPKVTRNSSKVVLSQKAIGYKTQVRSFELYMGVRFN